MHQNTKIEELLNALGLPPGATWPDALAVGLTSFVRAVTDNAPLVAGADALDLTLAASWGGGVASPIVVAGGTGNQPKVVVRSYRAVVLVSGGPTGVTPGRMAQLVEGLAIRFKPAGAREIYYPLAEGVRSIVTDSATATTVAATDTIITAGSFASDRCAQLYAGLEANMEEDELALWSSEGIAPAGAADGFDLSLFLVPAAVYRNADALSPEKLDGCTRQKLAQVAGHTLATLK